MAKTLSGCAWCERDDVELGLCCRRHARLVCAECTEGKHFLLDHPAAQAA